MSSSSLIRLAGLAALSSGVLGVIGDLLALVIDPEDPHLEDPALASTTSYAIVFFLYLLSTPLLLLGLVGLYASQSQAAGILGLVGFLVAFLGTVLSAGAAWFALFIAPALATEAPELVAAELGLTGFILTSFFAVVGWVLFGVATLRAGVYPRGAAVLLIVGGVIAFFPLPLVGVIFSVAIAWLGFLLFTGRGEAATSEQPSRVS